MFRWLLVLLLSSVAVAEAAGNKTLRDPTQPIGYDSVAGAEKKLKLQAVFYGGGRKEAIVNGKSVREGDVVLGRRVLLIKADKIVYEDNGRQRVLALRPSIFKQ